MLQLDLKPTMPSMISSYENRLLNFFKLICRNINDEIVPLKPSVRLEIMRILLIDSATDVIEHSQT